MSARVRSQEDIGVEAARGWWLFVAVGVASLVAGVILVTKPSNSLATLAVVVGIFLLIDGVIELLSAIWRPAEGRTLAVVIGLLGVIVGILLVRHPTHAVNAIGLLIGLWLVAAGVVRMLRAFVTASPFLQAVIAVVEIIVGIVVVSDPHIGYATLAILTGIWLVINGIGMIGLGLSVRKALSAQQ
jgi:uncharacterized membrane protein HdeD (DUF308 family)